MKKKFPQVKNHHEYCQYTYAASYLKMSWSCICDILNAYEKWKEGK